MKLLPTIALLSLTLSIARADTPAPTGNARVGAAKNAPLICPVSGDKIASPKAAYNSEVYKGKTYYFCCADCKPAFDKNPSKYLKSAAAHKS